MHEFHTRGPPRGPGEGVGTPVSHDRMTYDLCQDKTPRKFLHKLVEIPKEDGGRRLLVSLGVHPVSNLFGKR